MNCQATRSLTGLTKRIGGLRSLAFLRSLGAQNEVRYADLPVTQRLAVDIDGEGDRLRHARPSD